MNSKFLSIMAITLVLISSPLANAQYTYDEFQVTYFEPEDEELKEYHEWIKSAGGFESDAKAFSKLFKFPASSPTNKIFISFGSCGVSTAFYSPSHKSVVICYEFVKDILEAFDTIETWADSTIKPEEATLNTVRGILYHELGHALIDVLNLDVLGQEEDAVDGFATIILISSDKYQTIIDAAKLGYWVGTLDVLVGSLKFWDEHSLTLQRVYNVVCLLYGSDPQSFASLKGSYLLPKERADRCPSEYEQAYNSWNKQLASHIDTGEVQTPSPTPPSETETSSTKTKLQPAHLGPYLDKHEYTLGEYITIFGNVLDCADYGNKVTLKLYNPKEQVFHANTIELDHCSYKYSTQLSGALAVSGSWRVVAEFGNLPSEWHFILTSRVGDTTTDTLDVPPKVLVKSSEVRVTAKQIKDVLLVRIRNMQDSGQSIYGLTLKSDDSVFSACKGPTTYWEVVSCRTKDASFLTEGLNVIFAGSKGVFKFKVMKETTRISWNAYDSDGAVLDSGTFEPIITR